MAMLTRTRRWSCSLRVSLTLRLPDIVCPLERTNLVFAELASAFDFNADPAKDKGKVKETRLAEAVVRGGLDD